MPRVNLTDEEAEIIEARRRRNTAGIAHNRAVDLCKTVAHEWLDKLKVGSPSATAGDLITALEALREPLRN